MKKHKIQKNGKGHIQAIRIEFNDPVATTVSIAGTFNEWSPDATQMLHVGPDRWVKDLALPPGSYEYRLVVDGTWMPDPAARESVPNPFGEQNSVLKVTASA